MRLIVVSIAAVAALTIAACGRQEPVESSVDTTVSDHGSVAVDWVKDMPSAIERARTEDKLVLVTFYADWCVWCKRLDSTTLRDAKVVAMLRDRVVPLRLDVEGDGRQLSNEYRVDGLPTTVVLDADGREVGRIPGYIPPAGFLERIEGFLQES